MSGTSRATQAFSLGKDSFRNTHSIGLMFHNTQGCVSGTVLAFGWVTKHFFWTKIVSVRRFFWLMCVWDVFGFWLGHEAFFLDKDRFGAKIFLVDVQTFVISSMIW